MRSVLLLFAAFLCLTGFAVCQACPELKMTGPSLRSDVQELQGRLVFHDDLRQWFELKLDHPQCGQSSVELVRFGGGSTPLQTLRGCHVQSTGRLDVASTGYYSLEEYQDVTGIKALGPCAMKPPFPDYSAAKPDKAIRSYKVDMRVNYTPGDHPLIFQVSSSGRKLRPWQAYASYDLTGGFVLYGSCGKNFTIDKVFGTPQAKPAHFDEPGFPGDMAMFDPESAAAAGVKDLHLGYTCVQRKP